MSQEETKEALKEALKEWMDEKLLHFGKWTLRTLAAFVLTTIVSLILIKFGWK